MLTVQMADVALRNVSALVAYIISVTLAGYGTAWIAHKLGDDTPEQEGFLTLNPLAHVDPLGTFFLIMYRFGWARFVPINPAHITGRFRSAKIIFAYLVEPLLFLFLGVIALILLVALFGPRIFASESLFATFPDSSSYTLAIAYIILSMFGVNASMSVLSFLVNMCGLGVMHLAEEDPSYSYYAHIAMFVLPLAIYWFMGRYLINLVLGLMIKGGYILAVLFKLL